MSRKLVTYISTCGCKCINIGKGIPLEVGAAGREDFLYKTRDDRGDNISHYNEYYGDLTALYWIWKNAELDKHEYISFRHYNKHLYIRDHDALKYLRANNDGWIVAKAEENPPHNYKNEWETFRNIVKENYSFYYPELVRLYDLSDGSGLKCNTTNMFITSIRQMGDYCEVLFSICNDLRAAIGDTDHTRYDQRYCAFMAERFLSVYINAHSLPRMEVEVCRSKFFILRMAKAAKRMGIRKNTPFFNTIAKWLLKNNKGSSYLE